jgi:hypothetical protein
MKSPKAVGGLFAMSDGVYYQDQYYALLVIQFPADDRATLPVSGFVWGTLDPNMFVSACYFESGGIRRNADWMKSWPGIWGAKFSGLPLCHDGILTVESTSQDEELVFRKVCNNLSIDPSIPSDPNQEFPADIRSDMIGLKSPQSGQSWQAPYEASGYVTGSTRLSQCYFKYDRDGTKATAGGLARTNPWTASAFSGLTAGQKGSVTAKGDDGTAVTNNNITTA